MMTTNTSIGKQTTCILVYIYIRIHSLIDLYSFLSSCSLTDSEIRLQYLFHVTYEKVNIRVFSLMETLFLIHFYGPCKDVSGRFLNLL
jgi:hypothetical protein